MYAVPHMRSAMVAVGELVESRGVDSLPTNTSYCLTPVSSLEAPQVRRIEDTVADDMLRAPGALGGASLTNLGRRNVIGPTGRVQLGSLSAAQIPPHPPKSVPRSGPTVKRSSLPYLNFAEHVPPQSSPVAVTRPVPSRAFFTLIETSTRSGGSGPPALLNFTPTVCGSSSIVTMQALASTDVHPKGKLVSFEFPGLTVSRTVDLA